MGLVAAICPEELLGFCGPTSGKAQPGQPIAGQMHLVRGRVVGQQTAISSFGLPRIFGAGIINCCVNQGTGGEFAGAETTLHFFV